MHGRENSNASSRRQAGVIKSCSSFLCRVEIGSMKKSFYSLNFSELQNILQSNDFSPQTASHLYNWFYKKNQRLPYSHQNLSTELKIWIQENFSFDLPLHSKIQMSADKTVKFLNLLQDGSSVESVLIPFQGKYTLCLSSQVGCAMNCSFCYTGKQGYKRHLQVEEIIGQFLQAKMWLAENRPDDSKILNIVFMGQGEPLHNFDAVRTAIEIFLSQHGLSLADHKITVSTSGYLPGLERWISEMPPVNLALSLHSPVTEKRNILIPLNKKYSLHEVLAVIDKIPLAKKRFITFEYLLIADMNDSREDALLTGELLKDRKAIVNLIPFNPFPGSEYKRPNEEKIKLFKSTLEEFGLPVTLRTTKGDEILAACGQLNTKMSLASASL